MRINEKKIKELLDQKVDTYNQPFFIKNDPISIPHLFIKKQDIEIAGFFAAIFSWGNRTTIIKKSTELMHLMEMQPYEFCINHNPNDLKRLTSFRHRTFNTTDLLYFIEFLKFHYSKNSSLETAFFPQPFSLSISRLLSGGKKNNNRVVEEALINFHNYFFSVKHVPSRTKKHIASPENNSTCKRLNMYLRWMVRQDDQGIDFGIWKNILPSHLICPIDVHVARVARHLNLLERNQTDWRAALELTDNLRAFDKNDPVKYDLALFSMGVIEKIM